MSERPFQVDEPVRHRLFGTGAVIADRGATIVVRFEGDIRELQRGSIERVASLSARLARPVWDIPLEVLSRAQAETILSVNDAWGVFSRSRIALLPHQLWVCREVNREWPFRWLVADDVGLGKTIEAGLILTPLIASGRVRRLLVLCPASLVEQWQQRLRTMFDIRLAVYTPEADTPRTDFWHTHYQVVVSLQTLRADHKGRHDRLVEADAWDLMVVDEAHHLNADEKSGPTLGYQLAKKLVEHKRVVSMVYFTGTPHRGKTFGFLSLLHLLRPDLFDPNQRLVDQLPQLRNVMIRNNKYNVTDLHGKRLFQEPEVQMVTYAYSPEEQAFYDTLTDFICRGRAYAARLPRADQSAVALVLIAMQKLASSSVAAIRRAIRGRLRRMSEGRARIEALKARRTVLEALDDAEAGDALALIDEQIAELDTDVVLMEDEEPALRDLLRLADAIRQETKIAELLNAVESRFPGRSVLFFTEYKATQSLLMRALGETYGPGAVTFINGDGRADDVLRADGSVGTVVASREEAAARFNCGTVRFLVSTEAGGEGIDLQSACHTLIHVDLPWNPMRMHQRVGRLNRYGQQRRVTILSLRNPSTVEARIWQKLDEKLDRINQAFAHVMDAPEDLKQLVLGMATPKLFEGLLSDAVEAPKDRLNQWFDERTARLGGTDVVEAVRALVGNVNKFDFQQVSAALPKVDLPDLRHFFEAALTLNGRQPMSANDGITFNTPDAWRDSPAVRTRYERMSFDRETGTQDANRLLGVGHRVIDAALVQARNRDVLNTSLPRANLAGPLVVVRLSDRITEGATRAAVIIGAQQSESGAFRILSDWELLKRLNEVSWRKKLMREPSSAPATVASAEACINQAIAIVLGQAAAIAPSLRVPDAAVVAVFWPSVALAEGLQEDA